jgi:multidrug resistance efflux pump
MELSGKIEANTYQLRFANSGKLTQLNFEIGRGVSKGQLLARQDQTELQMYLDRELKQYEQIRAEFEEKQKTNLSEFDKLKIQADLDISVKNVEIAKSNLEATNLYSPINGIVIEVDPATIGMNVTPAGFTVAILNPNSFYFNALVGEEDVNKLIPDGPVTVTLKAFPDKTFPGKVSRIAFMPDKNGLYPVTILLDGIAGLRLGLSGTATL